MQENITTNVPSSSVCSNCNVLPIDSRYPSPLCEECRRKFIDFPIPKWIKLFGVAVAVVVCIALFNLPSQLNIALHLEKGKDAALHHRFKTASRELKLAINKIPNSQEAQAYLLISSFHNMDFKEFGNMFEKLKHQTFEDNDLFERVDKVMLEAQDYFPTDSFQAVINEYEGSIDSLPDSRLEEFIKQYPNEIFAIYNRAQRFYINKDYGKADTLLTGIIQQVKGYMPALQLLCSIKRLEGEPESSIRYCDRILEKNEENVYALSNKARSLLKMHKDKEALDLAINTYRLDGEDGYTLATLCIAYHFNGRQKDRDELIKKSKKDSTIAYYFEYALDVINNKESFR